MHRSIKLTEKAHGCTFTVHLGNLNGHFNSTVAFTCWVSVQRLSLSNSLVFYRPFSLVSPVDVTSLQQLITHVSFLSPRSLHTCHSGDSCLYSGEAAAFMTVYLRGENSATLQARSGSSHTQQQTQVLCNRGKTSTVCIQRATNAIILVLK